LKITDEAEDDDGVVMEGDEAGGTGGLLSAEEQERFVAGVEEKGVAQGGGGRDAEEGSVEFASPFRALLRANFAASSLILHKNPHIAHKTDQIETDRS
jgi:hypothetical protein